MRKVAQKANFRFFLAGCLSLFMSLAPTNGMKEIALPEPTSADDKLSVWKKLNTITGKDEFANFFGVRKMLTGTRSKGVELVQANCQVLTAPVPLDLPTDDASAIFYPTCVLLKRCGGCCFGNLLSCQPEETEDILIKVMKLSKPSNETHTRGRGGGGLQESSLTVRETNHKTCACKCITKASDCTPSIQTYNEKECSCDCTDSVAAKACIAKYSTHYWDSKDCKCYCRQTSECSSGFYFRHDRCNCVRMLSEATRIEFDEFNEISGR